jgi:DNA gyrase subunit A
VTTSNFTSINLTQELKTSYLTYSISIFNRALPSVVDGLKTAQRRIILGLKDLNLKPEGQYKKVSRLEGHVLGSYHPQGGCAGTAINMGQANSFRYLLTDIHGNVGGSIQSGPSVGQSISEDGPAAARYLEVKSSAFTQEVYISQVDKHSCSWRDNYDGSTQEVSEIIPCLPALLVNGAQGIAAGYACHHIPYNLSEVVKGTIEYVKNQRITPKKLRTIIKGPDLPQGSRILDDQGMADAFEKGSGTLKVYGEWEVKKIPYGKRSSRDAIIVTALASGSSERFLEKLKDAVESDKIIGVVDASDHSSRDGIQIQVVLKSGTDPNTVVSQLLAFTNLHDTIGVNATAISSGLPTLFGVKDVISEWHLARRDSLSKRYLAERERIFDRLEILNGFLTILADIDEVVQVIRKSKTKESAANNLKKRWKLTDAQAKAVLSMPLSRLVNAEKLELEAEKNDLESRDAFLANLLSNVEAMDEHIITQLEELKKFADKRRTKIVKMTDIGVEKAKTTTKSGTKRVKLPSAKDIIKDQAKKIGIKRTDLRRFFEENAGNTNLKKAWEEFKDDWAHSQQLMTRKGRAERKAALEKMKAAAIKKGMPQRGQYAWNKFIIGKEKAKIADIEKDLKHWLDNIG